MGLKIIAMRSSHLPTKLYGNLQSGSKDSHRSFMPKASNAFRSFLPYSKLHALVTTVTSAEDLCDVTTVTQQRKQSKTTT
jgi:hypothetical protein